MMSSAPPSPDLLLEAERHPVLLRRGPWAIELRGGELENISFDGEPVLRSVRFVMRDQDWRTVPAVIDAVEGAVDGSGSDAAVVIRGLTRDTQVSVRWSLTVRASANELLVELDAMAESDFLRNRLGLIVLHSPEVAGRALRVTHSDSSITETVFPSQIAPHQPAIDIRALAWAAGTGSQLATSLVVDGDVFEMEDQRNWTDASFKTYSTPLSEPFPVAVAAGDRVRQAVRVNCVDTEPHSTAVLESVSDSQAPALVIGRPRRGVVIPRLLTTASTAPGSSPADASQTSAWASALLVELDSHWPNWRAALDRALADAGDRPLDVRLIAADVDDAAPVLDALAEHPSSRFVRMGLFARPGSFADTDSAVRLVAALDARGLDVQVIAGTRAHFTEFNRGAERLDSWRGPITFSVIPFMHDLAGHQLVESIEMQREVAANAVRLAAGRPLHIGPITLAARFNAVATSEAEAPTADDLAEGYGAELVPGSTDGRTAARSLAPWLLGSVDALSAPRVLTLSYLEEWGPRAAGDPSATEALGWVAELAGAQVYDASAAGLVSLVARRASGRAVALLGNLTDRDRSVSIPGATSQTVPAGGILRVELPPGSVSSLE